jgi:DNA-binding GntR family transcriptional regulator
VDHTEKGDLVGDTDADREFHLRLLGYSGNTRLVEMVADFRSHSRLTGLTQLAERGELGRSAGEHLAMVNLIEQRRSAELEDLMKNHISHVRSSSEQNPYQGSQCLVRVFCAALRRQIRS